MTVTIESSSLAMYRMPPLGSTAIYSGSGPDRAGADLQLAGVDDVHDVAVTGG